MKKLLKHNISIFIYALLTVLFFTFSVSEDAFSLWPGQSSIAVRTGFLLLVFLAYKKIISSLSFTPNLLFIIFAIIISGVFSFASVMGVFYSADSGLSVLTPLTLWRASRLFLLFAGGFAFFYIMILALGSVSKFASHLSCPRVRRWSAFLFDEKCFLKSLIVIAVFWIPQIIVRYPCSVPIDSEMSLFQYYGLRTYTTQHPIIYTQLLGRFSDLGGLLGNVSIGLFALVLIQCVLLLLVLAYTIHTMKALGVPNWMLFIALVLFAVTPIFVGYATTLIVDVFYDTAILLLMDELTWYLFRQETYKKNWKHPALTACAVLGMYFRQNGFYVMAVLILFVAGRELYLVLRKKQTVSCALLILAVLVIPLGAGKMNTSYLHRKYNATRVSTRAMLAMPLQQTARYMVYHSDELSDEELEAIHNVITYTPEEFAEKYNPYNFDGIKKGFSYKVSKKELLTYLQTWFKLFLRHPETYINATLNQNYVLFSPLKDNSKYYGTARQRLEKITDPDFSTLYQDIISHQGIKQKLTQFYIDFCKIPVLGLYVNQGLISLLLLAICLYALCEKNGRLLLLGLPLLLTLAVTFVGPAAYGHPRYTFPIMYAMPLFFGIFLVRRKFETVKNTNIK